MAVSILIVFIVIATLCTFVILYKPKTRKCKFDKLYKNVSTPYVQLNGECHKKIMNKKPRLIVINELYYNMTADENIMATLSVCMSDLMVLLVHVSPLCV